MTTANRTGESVRDPFTREADARVEPALACPASFNQQGLWFLDRLESGSAAYHEPFAYRLIGSLDIATLERSLFEIVARHESLRTSFATQDEGFVQVVWPPAPIALPVTDLAEAGPVDDEMLQRMMTEEAQHPFDLTRPPALRARLFRIGAEDHVLLVTLHHVACDGKSAVIFFEELQTLYNAFRAGSASPLSELPIQYADYTVWQREQLSGEKLRRLRTYWKQRLEGLEPLDLPLDHPRPKVQRHRGARRRVSISAELNTSLRSIARQRKATPFMVFAAGFLATLHRYTGAEDIAIGTPVVGHDQPELEGLIGYFVNTVVLRVDASGDPTCLELLDRVRQSALDMYEHQELPFQQLLENAPADRDSSRNPLFQVMLAMHSPLPQLSLSGIEAERIPVCSGAAKFDLHLSLEDGPGHVNGALEFNTDLFDASTIERLIANFVVLLESVAKTPEAKVSALPLLTAEERARVLVAANDTGAAYPRDQSVATLFEAQAARTPEAIAVAFEGQTLTYAELNTRANTLAQTLRSLGVGPGVLVGICVERSTRMLVGLLAILKAGAAYVPLDPAFPPDRLKFMLEDSAAPVLLTETALRHLIPTTVTVVCLDTLAAPDAASPAPAAQPAGGDDLAYVLYTSGSTGKPKGVEISHRALTNFLWAMRTTPGCTDRDVVLALTTLSFDIAGLELYLPLIVGARIELASRQVASDGWLLKALIDKAQPTVLQATPASWRMLIAAGWTGTPGLKALIGGEALPPDLVAPLLARTSTLWNMYGPTETTIWSSVQQVTSAEEEITVGRPIANTRFYVLDTALQPTPIGVPGELFIGGDGLARGYRGRPELTAERFIADPFSGEPAGRLYRTGDRARFRADGRVVHMGRLDHQVKIRGFRIELGEIEAVLSKHDTVAQTCVIVRQDAPGEAVLAAYVVPQPGRATGTADLRQHLKAAVPDYMVPQHIVFLDAFPLTPNGKIDRKRLPAPNFGERVAESFVAPRTPVEDAICRIWSDLLGVPRVGIHDDFFELGGHSLRAMELAGRIQKQFAVEISLQAIFETPTVAGLAARFSARATNGLGGRDTLAIGRRERQLVARPVS